MPFPSMTSTGGEKKYIDELPAFLICNTRRLSLPTIYTAVFVPELCLKLAPKKIIMAIAVGVMCLD